ESDIALCTLMGERDNLTGEPFVSPVVGLGFHPPSVGSRVRTFAFPESSSDFVGGSGAGRFVCREYEGVLEESSDKPRDSRVITFPYYRTSIRILGGASGGPVFDDASRVFGINCTGYDGTDLSYMARIRDALDLRIDAILPGNAAPRAYTVRELIARGHVL